MPKNRFFVPTPLQKDDIIKLTNDEFHHLSVMRRQSSDLIEIVNGNHQLAEGTVLELTKSFARILLVKVSTSPPPKPLVLAQAYLKPKNLDLVIEKATELGVTTFLLFPSDNSEKKDLSPNQATRLQSLTISALKQCGRLDLPSIHHMPTLTKWPYYPKGSVFFGDLHSQTTQLCVSNEPTLFIGPEKGFTEKEKTFLSTLGQSLCFSPYTLRAETAAICGVALLKNYSFFPTKNACK